MSEQSIVVGASGAIGQAIVAELVRAGQHVLGVARSATELDKLAERHSGRFTAVVADMAEDSAVDVVAGAITASVAMVVHAPGLPLAGGVREAPPAVLAQACNIKVGGFLRLIRAAEPRLRRGSRLVAVGGHYGFEPTAYAAAAGVANAALANLIRQLSWAYGPQGFTAHLVAPGPADTERLHKIAHARAAKSGSTFEDIMADMRSESAIGAFVQPDQVAWAIALLLDPRADAFAGSALMMDAGRRHAVG